MSIFIYKTEFENKLIENEYDHVFIGHYGGAVNPNPEEVSEFRWVKKPDLKIEMTENPEKFAIWFRKIVDELSKRSYI